MQLLKFSLVVVSLGGTTYAIYAWRELSNGMRTLITAILVMTAIAAIPGFIEGLTYVWSLLPSLPEALPASTPHELTPEQKQQNERAFAIFFGLLVAVVIAWCGGFLICAAFSRDMIEMDLDFLSDHIGVFATRIIAFVLGVPIFAMGIAMLFV